MTIKQIYEIGERPPDGVVPARMHAQVIRPSRFGEPKDAFKIETLPVPVLGPRDVLVYVMAAGVNYNNVWAALGVPVNVIEVHNRDGDPSDFHIGGSEGAGIVWAVGVAVRSVRPGDEVVVHAGVWDEEDPYIRDGGDPILAPSARAFGFETNWGTFAQFARVKVHQCLPKPRHLTWEQAAAFVLSGATAYRMLHGFPEHEVRAGDVVLVWGGAGGLGTLAIQIAANAGARPVAVVSSDERGEYCKRLGAVGYVNRNHFDHWGPLPAWNDAKAYDKWLSGVRRFGKAIWDALGEKRNPRIVVEHPGEATLPTSMFVCDTAGMVVICGGTTGYNATLDVRYHWMRQKRLQGSHFANGKQCAAITALVAQNKIDPCLSSVFPFEKTAIAHQLMRDNGHGQGNMAVRVGCTGGDADRSGSARP